MHTLEEIRHRAQEWRKIVRFRGSIHGNLRFYILTPESSDYPAQRKVALNYIPPHESPNRLVSNKFARGAIIVTEEGVLQRPSEINLSTAALVRCFSEIKDACEAYAHFVSTKHPEVDYRALSKSMFNSFANILLGVGIMEHELNFFISVPYPENADLTEIAAHFQAFLSRVANAFETIGLNDLSLKINEFISRADQRLSETVLQLVFKVDNSTPLTIRQEISDILESASGLEDIGQINRRLDQLYQNFKAANVAKHVEVGSARVGYLITPRVLTTPSYPLELSRIFYGLLVRQVDEMGQQLPVTGYQISANKIGEDDGELTSHMLMELYEKLPQGGEQDPEISLLNNVAFTDGMGCNVYMHLLTVSNPSTSGITVREKDLPEGVYFGIDNCFELQVFVDGVDLSPLTLPDSLTMVCGKVANVINQLFGGSTLKQLRLQQFHVRKLQSNGAFYIFRAAGQNQTTSIQLEQTPQPVKGLVKVDIRFWSGTSFEQRGDTQITSSVENDPFSLMVIGNAVKAFAEYFFGNTDSPFLNSNYLSIFVPEKYGDKRCKNFQLYIYSLCQEVLIQLLEIERNEQNTLTYQFFREPKFCINGIHLKSAEENSHFVRSLLTVGYKQRPVRRLSEFFELAVRRFCQKLQERGFLNADFKLEVELEIETPKPDLIRSGKIRVSYPT